MQNTLITLSDNKIGTDTNADNTADFYTASVLSATDYYAFGMSMKERSWQSEKYRYGFNGKEKDKDIGEEIEDFGARLMNKKISRWMAVDPLAGKYAGLSPYNFVANNPLNAIDPDGRKILIIGNRDYVLAVMKMLDIIRKSSALGNEIVTALMTSDNIHAINALNPTDNYNRGQYFNDLASKKIISSNLAKEMSRGAAVVSHSAIIYSATGYKDNGDTHEGSGSDMYFNFGIISGSTTIRHKFLHELWHMYQNEMGAMGLHTNHNHGISSASDPDELLANEGADRLSAQLTDFAQSNNLSIIPSNNNGITFEMGSVFSNNPSDVVLNGGKPISFSVLFDNLSSQNGYDATPNPTITSQYENLAGNIGLLRKLPPTRVQKSQIKNIYDWIKRRTTTVSPSHVVTEYKPTN